MAGAANDVLPRLNVPDWVVTSVILTTLLGLPLVVVVAWLQGRAVEEPPAAPKSTGAEWARSSQMGGDRTSLVVLPFEDLSPNPADAFFATGLTDELIADLSRLHSLRVISRTTAFHLKGTKKDIRTIAEELGVQYVVEGSVRRSDQSLRITAQLIEARSDSHVWAQKYSGTLEDVFDLQEKLSRQIVASLRVSLTTDDEKLLAARPIADLRAYEHYLRARGNIYSFDAQSVERAERDMRAGLEILGDNALLLRGLGLALFQRLNAGLSDDVSIIASIEDCAARIMRLDPDDPGVFLLRGAAQVLRTDFLAAVRHLREAYRRDPRDTDVVTWLGILSLSTGQMELAGRLKEELIELDPLAPLASLLVSYHAYFDGRFDEAARAMEHTLRMGSDVPAVRWQAVRTFVAAKHADRAEESARFLSETTPESPLAESASLLIAGIHGRGASLPDPSPALRAWAARDAEWAQYLSDAYAFGGDEARALSWAESAVAAGFLNDAYLAKHDPFIARMRESPEWAMLLGEAMSRRREFEATLA